MDPITATALAFEYGSGPSSRKAILVSCDIVGPSWSVAGGSYGAVPASTLMGPEGGQELVEKTLEMINSIWEEPDN